MNEERRGGGEKEEKATGTHLHRSPLRATKHAVTLVFLRGKVSEEEKDLRGKEEDEDDEEEEEEDQCRRGQAETENAASPRGRGRASERMNERKREETRRASGCGRDEDGQAGSGGTCNESEKDDEIGLCRRRRDSTERAGVPQTGRRLSGMQASAPAPVQLVGRAGSLRSLLLRSISSSALLPSSHHLPIRFSRYPTPYGSHRCDFVVYHYHRQLRHANASAGARPRLTFACTCVHMRVRLYAWRVYILYI